MTYHIDEDDELGPKHDQRHGHGYKRVALRMLSWSLAITVAVMIVEAVGGWLSGSIALVSDAGHMLTHAFAISISIFGIIIARKEACHHRTFGLLRAEVLAALVNGLFLMMVCVWIVVASVRRFYRPREILTTQMLLIAALGLVVNVVSIVLLEESRHRDLNVRSVFMHMIGDTASSIAILIAAFVIRATGWVWLDPAVSIGISALIAVWAVGLLRESTRVLLEMAPKGHNVEDITAAMRKRYPMVLETRNERIWMITQEVIVFSAHLRVDPSQVPPERLNDWLADVEHWLAHEFDIAESTLQVKL